LIHVEFVNELVDAAKKKGIHICLDTSGFCQWSDLEPLAKKVDITLYDLKHLDPAAHERMTGARNELILQNLSRLVENGFEVWLRVLIIPGFSDSLDYHRKVVDFLKSLPRPIERVDLLPFHNWCEGKYRWLGREWPMGELQAIDPAEVNPLTEVYEAEGLNVTIGGSGFEKFSG